MVSETSCSGGLVHLLSAGHLFLLTAEMRFSKANVADVVKTVVPPVKRGVGVGGVISIFFV